MLMDPAKEAKPRDPVCGMTVDARSSERRYHHAGHTYYFCSAGCLSRFAASPEKYLGVAQQAPSAPLAAGTVYTCPMHPEVRQLGPGACPICGMALEPEVP